MRLGHIFIVLPFKVVERRKQIEIEEQEIKRKEKELIATVKFSPPEKLVLVAEKKCVPAEKLGR